MDVKKEFGKIDVIDSHLHMYHWKDMKTGELVHDATSCAMCKRHIINAGIAKVVVRRDENTYEVIDVEKDWIENDDSLGDKLGY